VVRAYNPCMLHAFDALLAPALMERLTLLINHVLASEGAAVERLRPHAGHCIQLHLENWPALLPVPPAFAFRVTPAGLLEWCGGDTPQADLHVHVDASNPALLLARALTGEAPPVAVEGDAALATQVNWLIENLRWDMAADLERAFGPRAAHQLVRFGSALARGVTQAVRSGADLAARLRPEGLDRRTP
jgi:ubiquinone biosynthesis accessory factor UbiJ